MPKAAFTAIPTSLPKRSTAINVNIGLNLLPPKEKTYLGGSNSVLG